jgi:hypothetical protein
MDDQRHAGTRQDDNGTLRLARPIASTAIEVIGEIAAKLGEAQPRLDRQHHHQAGGEAAAGLSTAA